MAGQFEVPYTATHHKVYAQDREEPVTKQHLSVISGEMLKRVMHAVKVNSVGRRGNGILQHVCTRCSYTADAYMQAITLCIYAFPQERQWKHTATHTAQVLALHTTNYHCITHYMFLDKSGHFLHH